MINEKAILFLKYSDFKIFVLNFETRASKTILQFKIEIFKSDMAILIEDYYFSLHLNYTLNIALFTVFCNRTRCFA